VQAAQRRIGDGGLWEASKQGLFQPAERIVCLLTGHGFKDEAAARRLTRPDAGHDVVVSPEDIDERLVDQLLGATA